MPHDPAAEETGPAEHRDQPPTLRDARVDVFFHVIIIGHVQRSDEERPLIYTAPNRSTKASAAIRRRPNGSVNRFITMAGARSASAYSRGRLDSANPHASSALASTGDCRP
jgi:hypothetical protein